MAADPAGIDQLVTARQPGAFTDADTENLPEGYIYEIVDGMLVVNPRPSIAHQVIAAVLFDQLRRARPSDVHVLWETDYKPVEGRTLAPDIVVARLDAFTERALVGTPLLLVEVRSPSSETYDRSFKRRIYQEAGVPTYWLVDPDQPSLTVLELGGDGEYVEAARLTGDDELRLERPFPVTIRLV